MTLREALKMKYPSDDDEDIQATIDEMVAMVDSGEDPEEVLHNEGLEPDYVFDLLDECM